MAKIRLFFVISAWLFLAACAEEATVAPDGPCPTEACLNGGQCQLVAAEQACAAISNAQVAPV